MCEFCPKEPQLITLEDKVRWCFLKAYEAGRHDGVKNKRSKYSKQVAKILLDEVIKLLPKT